MAKVRRRTRCRTSNRSSAPPPHSTETTSDPAPHPTWCEQTEHIPGRPHAALFGDIELGHIVLTVDVRQRVPQPAMVGLSVHTAVSSTTHLLPLVYAAELRNALTAAINALDTNSDE